MVTLFPTFLSDLLFSFQAHDISVPIVFYTKAIIFYPLLLIFDYMLYEHIDCAYEHSSLIVYLYMLVYHSL